MVNTSERTFEGLIFVMLPGFTLKEDRKEEVPSRIPEGTPSVERFQSHVDAAGHGVYLFAWDDIPQRDRGPMKAEESWTAQVGTEIAQISLASFFFGQPKQVLVAHFQGPAPKKRPYMVYTTLIDRNAFASLLASMRFEP
jgi:hypothetical protein